MAGRLNGWLVGWWVDCWVDGWLVGKSLALSASRWDRRGGRLTEWVCWPVKLAVNAQSRYLA